MEDLVQYLRLPEDSPLYSKLLPSLPEHSIIQQLLQGLADYNWDSRPHPSIDTPKHSPVEPKPKKQSVGELIVLL